MDFLPDIHPIVIALMIFFNIGLAIFISVLIRALFISAYLRNKVITAIEDNDNAPNTKDAMFVITALWGSVICWIIINSFILMINELLHQRSVVNYLPYIGAAVGFATMLLGIKVLARGKPHE